jgi:hypothetical protein
VWFRSDRPRGGARVMAEPQFPAARNIFGALFTVKPRVQFVCGVPLYANDNIRELRFWFTVVDDSRVFEARVDAQGPLP